MMATAATNEVTGRDDLHKTVRIAAMAWLSAAIYYFYQYALRSAPAVMMPELSNAFDLSPLVIASMVGLFYYGYSPFSLVAGVAIDRVGPRRLLPGAAAVVGMGALLFATGNSHLASVGRLMQGAGGVFALVGAIYIATTNFPPSRAATLIGATQMFGMAGGWAGQFIVGPLIASWCWHGVRSGRHGRWRARDRRAVVCLLLPAETVVARCRRPVRRSSQREGTVDARVRRGVQNPQSILCGVIAGLMFIPTTIFDMVWGVRYLQEAHGFGLRDAVLRSSGRAVRLDHRLPAARYALRPDQAEQAGDHRRGVGALACLVWILYGKVALFPP